MLSTIRKQRDEEGFTLIELLVVVLIIGILAAIAIPVFLNQRENAWRSAVESDLRNAAVQIETVLTREGVYPNDFDSTGETDGIVDLMTGTTPADSGIDVTISDDVTLVYDVTDNAYTIVGTHTMLGTDSITYDSDAGGLGSAEWVTTP